MKIAKKYEDGRGLIVKVQIPLATNEAEPLAYVYNRDRDYKMFMQITPDLIEAMRGTPKKFFHAHYDLENNDTVLGKEAPWQSW